MKHLLQSGLLVMLLVGPAVGQSSFPSGQLEVQGSMLTQDQNKANVVAFYNLSLNDKRPEEAIKKYVGASYVQHNPKAADGPEGVIAYVNLIKDQFPSSHSEIKKVFADGDFVMMHVHTRRTPDALGLAIAELFRLENGKIVEHWDVIQPVPETAANNNTMF